MTRYFGTDGIRGIANQELTPELVFRLGLATGTLLKSQGKIRHMIIGMDSRRSGPMLGAALAAGLCSAGIHVYEAGVMPTPAISFLARTMEACGGAVISASHNPAPDNGIKFFSHDGCKLDDAMEAAIEDLMDRPMDTYQRPVGTEVGWIRRLPDGADRYAEHLKEKAPCRLNGLVVVVDCANGAASDLGPRILREMGAQVISLHDLPDGCNINDQCGSTHLKSLQQAVLQFQADLGLAFDGDADRLLAVDAAGQVVDGDQILVILGLHMQKTGSLDDQVVVTVMSNLGLKKAFQAAGVTVHETGVGDRFVFEKMVETNSWLGGEQSGHIILTRCGTTGDGILTALHLLSVVKTTGRSLQELASQMVRYPQVLVNVQVRSKEGWQENSRIREGCLEIEEALAGQGRLLLRPSGTEPLLRVMVEGPELPELETLAHRLADVIRQELG